MFLKIGKEYYFLKGALNYFFTLMKIFWKFLNAPRGKKFTQEYFSIQFFNDKTITFIKIIKLPLTFDI